MNIFQRRCAPWLAVIAASALAALPVSAGEFKVRAQLAWGTDDMKPNDPALHELDPKIREKFRHLRWKNYFVVKSETVGVPQKEPKKVQLSEKCLIDVREKDAMVEVRIYSAKAGAAPSLVKTDAIAVQKLKDGHVFAFAGDTKEKWDDAWLVIVTAGE